MIEYSFLKDFKYQNKNPYNERLLDFSEFVYRDNEAENFQNKWNKSIFKREAPIIVEIGSGYGHFMMEFCEKHPEINYIGMDHQFKRTFNLAKKLKNHTTKNFRYLRAKGERIGFLFDKNEIDSIFFFFPDPWPKTRHHKKRLFQEPFLEIAHNILKPGGKIFIKTDHDEYAQWMNDILEKTGLFQKEFFSPDVWKEHPEHFLCNFKTKFEKIFLERKIQINAFVARSTKE